MHPEQWANLEFKVGAADNVSIRADSIHSAYELRAPSRSVATSKGHLELFTLKPLVDSNLPSFSGRWDWKTVDVDMLGASITKRGLFKAESLGYKGHRTRKVADSPRCYEIDISVPDLHVFAGQITLNLTFEKRVEGHVSFVGSLAKIYSCWFRKA